VRTLSGLALNSALASRAAVESSTLRWLLLRSNSSSSSSAMSAGTAAETRCID
jgi:hypothetical protein